MKYIIIIFVFISIACNQSAKTSHPQGSKFEHLLSKFKDISFDTLEVYSIGEGNEKNYKYDGVKLDSVDAVLFPPDIARAHFIDPPGLFACFKFKIDSARIGLIARTPSEYAPTSIKLFIYKSGKDTLEENSELAQYIGDAGGLREVNSWLFKNLNNEIQVFTWTHDSEDNSVENENDTTISISNYFHLSNLSTNKRKKLDTSIANLPLTLRKFVVDQASR
jgi:hypothetical protein